MNNTGGDKVNITTQYFLFQQLKQCITFLNSNPFHLSMSLLQFFLKRKNVTVHSQATSSSKCPFWNESWAPSRTVTQKYILLAIHSNSVATVGWCTVGALTSMSLLVQKRQQELLPKAFLTDHTILVRVCLCEIRQTLQMKGLLIPISYKHIHRFFPVYAHGRQSSWMSSGKCLPVMHRFSSSVSHLVQADYPWSLFHIS